MIDVLQYDFMRYALVAGVLASIACGIIGTYVVTKRIVFISGGISHAAFGGIGLGYFLGVSPFLGAIAAGVFFAVVMGFFGRKMGQRDDTVIGVVWSFGMAMGILFVYMTPGYAPDMMGYLFGSILAVPLSEIYLMFALDVVIVATVWVFYKEFFAVCFDEEFARVRGVKVDFVNVVLLCLIALTVVLLIRVVGIILVIAMLSIPAAIAGRFVHDMRRMMGVAVLVGAVFMVAGLGVSYALDLPSGATIILVAVAGFVLSGVFGKK
ncbi:MAG: metal ABC transporter permease [Candidatus Aenigmarchaeota archaeon]|nr:metal ABC transporter permease [Candidatus Aenigmarchaeota archaeon]